MYLQTWSAEGEYLVRNNHINVVVSGGRFGREKRSEITIDFNDVNPDRDARRRRIGDKQARSMYLTNLAVQEFRAGRTRSAFAFVQHALRDNTRNVDTWINLAAFYSKNQRPDLAVKNVPCRYLPRGVKHDVTGRSGACSSTFGKCAAS